MNFVEGIPCLGTPRPEAPMAWCKQTATGLGLIRIHWARDRYTTACGVLNLETSPYMRAGYTPVHVAYATSAAAIAVAMQGVLYANKTDRSSAICRSCQRSNVRFRALIDSAVS